jgi:hypothetical protein
VASHPIRQAIEAADRDAILAELADDVVFNSPVLFKPFLGREAAATVLDAVLEVFEDFEYTDELGDGAVRTLVFRARVGDRELWGIDLLRLDEAGKVAQFTVFVRPMSALAALAEAMQAKLGERGLIAT